MKSEREQWILQQKTSNAAADPPLIMKRKGKTVKVNNAKTLQTLSDNQTTSSAKIAQNSTEEFSSEKIVTQPQLLVNIF